MVVIGKQNQTLNFKVDLSGNLLTTQPPEVKRIVQSKIVVK